MDANQDRRRGHFHRGRRGPDRRGFDRRSPAQPQAQAPPPRDQVDVEQIMREIRARIAHRQGVDLSHQQVDDLAARRLEYILDPRAMKPEFLETLRRSADETVERDQKRLPAEPAYVFEDTTIYDSHRTILRVIRKLLNPFLKLFLNPNPLIQALHQQARINVEAADRDAARDRRQAEWNALHYRILERLVTEVSRVTLELQALSTRVESLGARVDFGDRRVRAMEGSMHQLRPGGRPQEAAAPVRPPAPPEPREPAAAGDAAPEPTTPASAEGARRRRRRRRGRRGGAIVPEASHATAVQTPAPDPGGIGGAGESAVEPHQPALAAAPETREPSDPGSPIPDPGSPIPDPVTHDDTDTQE